MNPNTYDFLAPAEQPDEIGRLGSYRILSVLGAGGMGMVFKAEDPTLRRSIALKVMLPQVAKNPTARSRFIREARAQAAVEHDHVIAIHQVGEDREVPFLAMPLLKGQTLAALLKATPRVPLQDLLRIARETAEGLAAAHEKGLVHRDIKPANIWLEGTRQRVKILDFGLARVSSENEPGAGEEPVTKAGATVGTPAYMSPEQARGLSVDHRTDLFSLGVLMYQMGVGEIPFRGSDVMGVLRALAMEAPVPPMQRNPEIPQAVNDLILCLLSKNADERPENGDLIAEELRRIEEVLFRPAPSSQPPESYIGGSPYPGVPAFAEPAAANPWADIDATETGLELPAPAAVTPKAPSAVIPAAGAASTGAPMPPPVSGSAPSSSRSATSRPLPPAKKKAGLALIALGGVLAIALLGGLAWFAIQTAVGPQGMLGVMLDPEVPPEVQIVLVHSGERTTVKAGDTTLSAGEYSVELAPDFRQGYRVSPPTVVIAANARTEIKVRPVKTRPKSAS